MNENSALNHFSQQLNPRDKITDDNPTDYVEKDDVDDEGGRNFNVGGKSEFNSDINEETTEKAKNDNKQEESVDRDPDLDATKLYLYDIGKLGLLTKKEESVLGRQIEIGDRINELTVDFDIREDTSFNSTIVAASMKLVCSKFKIIEHLLQSLGESSEISFANLAKNEDFRKMIDSYFDEVLVTSLSQKMNQPIDEVEQQIK